jgi:negative regulator of sigma E activity
MKPGMDRLSQQHERHKAELTPSGVRLKPGSARDEELMEMSPAFRILLKNPMEQPNPQQWREFTRTMAARLDAEAASKSNYWSVQTIRDKFIATDSKVLRAAGYAMLVITLAVIAAIVWAAMLLIVPTSAPQAAALYVQPSIRVTAKVMVPAKVPADNEAAFHRLG